MNSHSNENIQLNKVFVITVFILFLLSLTGNLFLYSSGKMKKAERDREVLKADSLISVALSLKKELYGLKQEQNKNAK